MWFNGSPTKVPRHFLTECILLPSYVYNIHQDTKSAQLIAVCKRIALGVELPETMAWSPGRINPDVLNNFWRIFTKFLFFVCLCLCSSSKNSRVFHFAILIVFHQNGVEDYLLIPPRMFSIKQEMNSCDKIGVSFTAFRMQGGEDGQGSGCTSKIGT